MADSRNLAGLIGPTTVLLAISEALNFHIFTEQISPLVYLNGALLFIGGLAIVRAHNRWRGWPIVITIMGWILIGLGLVRMFFPESRQADPNKVNYWFFGFLCIIGIFLTFKGYFPLKNKEKES